MIQKILSLLKRLIPATSKEELQLGAKTMSFIKKKNIDDEVHLYEEYAQKGNIFQPSKNVKKIKTQKAKGVLAIEEYAIHVQSVRWSINRHLLFEAGREFTKENFNYPVFVRPCPTVPRHGFVDSTTCKTATQLNKISKQTHKVEPKAELLITKPIPATYSAIISGDRITFGPGNDGATSGKQCQSLYISEPDYLRQHIIKDNCGITEDQIPYYELVCTQRETFLVQVRGGPELPTSKNFVPNQLIVNKVVKAEGDLLKWETIVRSLNPKTTVIDHTEGTLSSHYAVHAILNNIPIFTENCPRVGDLVVPTEAANEITDEERKEFANAYLFGLSNINTVLKENNGGVDFFRRSTRQIVELAVACLHNFSALYRHRDWKLLGTTLGLFARVCYSVSAGEMRHANSKANKEWKNIKACHTHEERGKTYRKNLCLSAPDVQTSIEDICKGFSIKGWESGFGGKAWANCTSSIMELHNHCVDGDIKEAVAQFNNVIHEEHNGGLYLNKVVNSGIFDTAARNSTLFMFQNLKNSIHILGSLYNQSQPKEYCLRKLFISASAQPKTQPKKAEPTDMTIKRTGKQTLLTSPDICIDLTNDYSWDLWNTTEKETPLYSGKIPYWYTNSKGKKVISKAKVTKLCKQNKS